jgi:hypothetical protein
LTGLSCVVGSTGASGFFNVAYGDNGNLYYGSLTGLTGSGSDFPAGQTVTFSCTTVGSPQVVGDVYAGVTQIFFYARGSTNSTFTSYSISSVG